VLTAPAIDLLRAFCTRAGLAPEHLVTATWAVARQFGTDDVMEPLDRPLVDEAAWGAMVEQELRERCGVEADMSNFGARWLEGQNANVDWVEELLSLRARGHFVGLLSNMMPTFEPHWRSMTPPGELFDDLVLSYEVGLRKPKPAIFALAAERAGAAPDACLLVDDIAANCEAARMAGWTAVEFTSAARAIAATESVLTCERRRATRPGGRAATRRRPIR